MWPREGFDRLVIGEGGGKGKLLARGLELIEEPGVYVLYREDIPYYIGQAATLRHRLWKHANEPGGRYNYFWNYFSVFVIEDPGLRNEVEGILIAAMPTANSATPKLPNKAKYPPVVRQMVREIRRSRANPARD